MNIWTQKERIWYKKVGRDTGDVKNRMIIKLKLAISYEILTSNIQEKRLTGLLGFLKITSEERS